MAWVLSPLTKSGLAAAVGYNFSVPTIPDSSCMFFTELGVAFVMGPSPSYVESSYVEPGYAETYGSGEVVESLQKIGAVFQDPLYLPFVNKGHTRDYFCEPYEDGDYVDEVFPGNYKVSSSLLNGNNIGLFGSKIRSSVVAPNVVNIAVTYDNSNMSTVFVA